MRYDLRNIDDYARAFDGVRSRTFVRERGERRLPERGERGGVRSEVFGAARVRSMYLFRHVCNQRA